MAASEFIFDVEVMYGDLGHLRPIGGRPPIRQYLRDMWRRRHFIWREARSKVSSQNSNERLGPLWLVIRPLLDAAFYWVIFGLLLDSGRGEANYVAFVIIGVLMFGFTSRCLTGGTSSMRNARAMIRAFSFPRASISIALLTREFLQQIPVVIVMLVAILAIPPHALPTLTWLWLPVILAMQIALNLGFMLVFARLGHAMPDLGQAMSFVTRILMYGSGVIFPIERFVTHPGVLAVVQLNPVYVVLNMYREILIHNTTPPLSEWLTLAAWAIGLIVLGFFLVWSAEEEFAREN